jgi:hypothetical protein
VCDIFIEYQDGDEEEIRFVSVKQAEETANKTIKVLSLEEALKALNFTFEDLNKVDYINEKLYNERKEIYKTTADIIVPDLDATLSAEYILSKRREDSGFENFSY